LRLRPGDGAATETAAGYVVVAENEASRILHWGVERLLDPGVTRLRQSSRAQGRVEVILAVLALAGGDGMEEEDCFAEAYGFPFVAEVHRGVFDVLIHRARASLGEGGAIRREGGRIRLVPCSPLVLPDPRTSQRTTDRVLRLLSERGGASAREAAGGLGISLRAAQAALKQLAESGACDAVRGGRSVEYVVEDTVFSEPTRKLTIADLEDSGLVNQVSGEGGGVEPGRDLKPDT
jgi:hypothetical protein